MPVNNFHVFGFSSTRVWLPVLTLALGAAVQIHGQDFFRDLGTSRSSGGIGPAVTASDYTYTDARPSEFRTITPNPTEVTEQADTYNFALGPVRFGVAVGVGLEFNDNITLSDNHRESDMILRPLINLDATWPISETNTLRLGIGASYAKYFDHSQYDSGGLLVSPTSALTLGIQVGAVKITVRDRFSYQEEPYDVAPLSNVANYRRYENQAGIDVDWPINQMVSLGVGYDHANLWTSGSNFSSQDHSIETLFIRPTIQLTPGIKVGLFGSYSAVSFESSERGDTVGILVGPTVDITFSEHLALYVEAGYQSLSSDGTSRFEDDFLRKLTPEERALFNDSSDSGDLYFKLELSHKVGPIFEHALSASHTTELGFYSNSYDLYHIEYSAAFKGLRNTEVGPLLFYEHYETSGNVGEKADRWGAAIAIRHHFSNNFTVGLDYRFLYKDSNVRDNDYYQNIAFLSLYYRF